MGLNSSHSGPKFSRATSSSVLRASSCASRFWACVSIARPCGAQASTRAAPSEASALVTLNAVFSSPFHDLLDLCVVCADACLGLIKGCCKCLIAFATAVAPYLSSSLVYEECLYFRE